MALDYGHDLVGITDLDAGMAELDGRQVLAQALARRLLTPRGGLIDDPNYGFDVRQFLNDDMSTADLARVAAGIDAELSKDERVVSSATTLALLAGVLMVSAQVTDGAGTFPLVLAVGSVSTALLTVPT